MKRKLLILLFLTALPYYALAQLSTCAYYDGYWGQWKAQYLSYTRDCYYKIFGGYNGFTVYSTYDHPSNYSFKFQISSYTPPSKETIKYHYKNNIPFEYSGIVEYFVSESYPSIKSALKSWGFTYVKNGDSDSYKRTVNATIKIFPYKKHPKCYNIFFDDVAIGLDLGTWEFKQ